MIHWACGKSGRVTSVDVELKNNDHILIGTTSRGDWEKKVYVDWIYSAKTENTSVKRITEKMGRLEKNMKFHDK